MTSLPSQSLFPNAIEEHERFEELLKLFPVLQQLCINGEQNFMGFKQLIGDIWLAFYCIDKVHLVNENGFNGRFMNELLKSEQYGNWSVLTQYDDLLSLITTMSVAENLSNQFEKQEEFNALAQKKNDNELTKQFSAKSFNINAIIEKSKANSKQLKETLVQIHGIEGKKLGEIPLKEQLQLAETLQNNETIKKIAELTGRFKRIALKKFKSKQKISMQRQDVTLGQELSRTLPIELASLVMPQSKLAFYRKFVEHETMIFDQKGKDSSGRGPIIICMDESSSMTPLKGQSKAFCIALLTVAKKQKRDFAIVPFASQIGEVMIFKKGQATTQELLHFSDQFLTGGTNYEHPLRESIQILTQSEFNEGDILFVTDGSSFLSSRFIEEFNEVKRKKQFECTSIVLTNLYNAVDLTIVNKFSDRVIEVSELFEAHEAFSI